MLFEKTTPFGGYNGLISDGDHDYKNIKDKELKDFIAQDLFPTSCSQILGTLFAWTIVFIFIGFVAFTYLTR